MSQRRSPPVSSRKSPKQARSEALVAAVLEAALQVLAEQGAQRFTTARVAERAGVSVGSLYQYFPNKAAILFRLQTDEWRRTAALLHGVLDEPGRPPLERLRALVHAFLRSECEEAAMRIALADAAPLYRDAPEAREAESESGFGMETFLREVLPGADEATRRLAGGLIGTSLGEVGRRFSEVPRSPAEIATHADALADMVCAYLEILRGRTDGSAARAEAPGPANGRAPA